MPTRPIRTPALTSTPEAQLPMTKRIVQKFGGSSVATPAHLRRVAERIIASCRAGHAVTAVVSAMGGSTDELLALAREVSDDPPRRELDLLLASGEQVSASLLAMALHSLGQPAVALTGSQGGIRTRGPHGDAHIETVDTGRVEAELTSGRVVVVAGFQGVASDGEVTTLGRGGSDTTAVALAAAVDADRCQILSDVDGIYTADPRVVPDARRLDRITHSEMAELARQGAQVLNEQAVRLAEESDVTIEAASTFDPGAGTLVASSPAEGATERPLARGIASRGRVLRVSATRPGSQGQLGPELRDALSPNDVLHADVGTPDRPLELVASLDNAPDPAGVVRSIRSEFGEVVAATAEVGSVAAVGLRVGRRPASVPRTQRALATSGAAPAAVHSSDHAVTCVIERDLLEEATRALHAEFVESDWSSSEGGAT